MAKLAEHIAQNKHRAIMQDAMNAARKSDKSRVEPPKDMPAEYCKTVILNRAARNWKNYYAHHPSYVKLGEHTDGVVVGFVRAKVGPRPHHVLLCNEAEIAQFPTKSWKQSHETETEQNTNIDPNIHELFFQGPEQHASPAAA